MPITAAFALNNHSPIPLLYLIFISPFLLISKDTYRNIRVFKKDLSYFVVLFLGMLPFMLSEHLLILNVKNYLVAILVIYIFYFVAVRFLLLSSRVSWEIIGNSSVIVLFLLTFSLVVEFILINFYNLHFNDLIPFPDDQLLGHSFITENYEKPRGFTTEPGLTSLAYECLWPLTFIVRRKNFNFYLLQFFFLIGFSLLASAAGVLSLFFAVMIFYLATDLKKFYVAFMLLVSIFWILLIGDFDIIQNLFLRKLELFSGVASPENTTVIDRLSAYSSGIKIILNNPFGIGWGNVSYYFKNNIYIPDVGNINSRGMISLYLEIAIAAGVLGFVFFIYFLISKLLALILSSNPLNSFVMISLLAVCLHHLFVSELQDPFFWFSLALADKVILQKT